MLVGLLAFEMYYNDLLRIISMLLVKVSRHQLVPFYYHLALHCVRLQLLVNTYYNLRDVCMLGRREGYPDGPEGAISTRRARRR